MKTILTFCLIGLSYFSSAQTYDFMHNSVTRTYIVHLPTGYTPSSSYPMVINMHGYTSDGGQQQFYSEMDAVADTANFIVVYPNGHGNPLSWNSGQLWSYTPGMNDVTFISALIDTMAMNFSVDISRVYACGMSNGGFMSYRLACELEDKIAAIASVTGVMADSIYNNCQTDRPVPIMHIHGTTDPTVNYNGQFGSTGVEDGLDWWITNNNCPTTATITSLPDTITADNSTVETYHYGPCDAETEILFFKISGGGHTWPGAVPLPVSQFGETNLDFDATGEIWTFFSRHTMPAVTNINEGNAQLNRKIKIWPNPAAESVYVGGLNADDKLNVVNMLGQNVIPPVQVEDGMQFSTLNNALLQKGAYLVKVTTNANVVTQARSGVV